MSFCGGFKSVSLHKLDAAVDSVVVVLCCDTAIGSLVAIEACVGFVCMVVVVEALSILIVFSGTGVVEDGICGVAGCDEAFSEEEIDDDGVAE